jgi:hypothetical protein
MQPLTNEGHISITTPCDAAPHKRSVGLAHTHIAISIYHVTAVRPR